MASDSGFDPGQGRGRRVAEGSVVGHGSYGAGVLRVDEEVGMVPFGKSVEFFALALIIAAVAVMLAAIL